VGSLWGPIYGSSDIRSAKAFNPEPWNTSLGELASRSHRACDCRPRSLAAAPLPPGPGPGPSRPVAGHFAAGVSNRHSTSEFSWSIR